MKQIPPTPDFQKEKIMHTKLSTLFVFVLVFALALTACGPTPQDVCGDRPVDSYNKETGEIQCARIEIAATAENAPAVVQSDPAPVENFTPYESEGGVPFSGSEWNADVAPDEIEVLTAGPLTIAGVSLKGGETRGSVLILLPGTKVVTYKVTNLLSGSNWHASYRPLSANETTWRALAADRVAAMQLSPNCTPGKGCLVVDVLVIGPAGVVAQWTVQ